MLSISDFDMPKSCATCEVWSLCYEVWAKDVRNPDKREEFCPLVENDNDVPFMYDTESWKMTFTDLSPVEYAQVKHGHWQDEASGRDSVCTVCRCYWIPSDAKYDFKYCPRCGAKMDGKEINNG